MNTTSTTPPRSPSTEDLICAECNQIAAMLIEKNRAYGDSALRPLGIFARGSAEDLIRVRIDDKLNRIRNQPEAFGEDAVLDLIGYLVLYRIATVARKEASCEYRVD
jgi:hypothetical protein